MDMQARGPITVQDRPQDGKTSQEFHCSGPQCQGAWRTPLCSRPRETAHVLFLHLLRLFPPLGSQPPLPSAPASVISIKPTARMPTTYPPRRQASGGQTLATLAQPLMQKNINGTQRIPLPPRSLSTELLTCKARKLEQVISENVPSPTIQYSLTVLSFKILLLTLWYL